MFDVEVLRELVIQSVTFYPNSPSGSAVNFNVDLYTATGSFSGKESFAGAWTQIISSESISTTCKDGYLACVSLPCMM